MRKIILFGATAVVLALGVASAMASEASTATQASAARVQEGRAVLENDVATLRPYGSSYHDPRFSLQQDDIYDGRF